MESPNTGSLAEQFVQLGLPDTAITDLFRSYNGWADAFRHEADRRETR
jgi:hypothetical protein